MERRGVPLISNKSGVIALHGNRQAFSGHNFAKNYLCWHSLAKRTLQDLGIRKTDLFSEDVWLKFYLGVEFKGGWG
jgi:hypothetical protein